MEEEDNHSILIVNNMKNKKRGFDMPEISRQIEGKKFMWDGIVYNNETDARDVKSNYKKEDFETGIIEEDGKFLVYTRRISTEIILEGDAPL